MSEVTENLLQKLEEKMMMLLSDFEGMRDELQHAHEENKSLRLEKDNSAKRLQGLVAMLDSVVEPSEPEALEMVAPALMQG